MAGLGASRRQSKGDPSRPGTGASLTFSSGGVPLLQDDPLPVQTGYGGAEVQGLLLSTLEAEMVQGVTHPGQNFLDAVCVAAADGKAVPGLLQSPRPCHLGRAASEGAR